MINEYIFWVLIAIIFYNYIGYTILLSLLVLIKKVFYHEKSMNIDFTPEITLIIPAYNEIQYVHSKLENTNHLNYPKDKLKVIWVTDGSNDGSFELLQKEKDIIILHEDKRTGKIGAVNRAMKYVKTPFVVFCDANSILNIDCIKEIVKPFKKEKVGCVAGEKKIYRARSDKAVGTGEGLYWKYESLIKKLESQINSTVGAAGELFAIRTELYEEIPGDSVIEDFVISLMIIKKSYKTRYAPKAFSVEAASLNIKEELKRKVRIAYGSIQTLTRHLDLLNPFKYGFFTFQYLSHKVLRWTLVPLFIPLIIFFNVFLYVQPDHNPVYYYSLIFQGVFYSLAFMGMFLKNKKIAFGIFFIPFYLLVMNFAIIKGYIRFLFNKQSVKWEKVKRG